MDQNENYVYYTRSRVCLSVTCHDCGKDRRLGTAAAAAKQWFEKLNNEKQKKFFFEKNGPARIWYIRPFIVFFGAVSAGRRRGKSQNRIRQRRWFSRVLHTFIIIRIDCCRVRKHKAKAAKTPYDTLSLSRRAIARVRETNGKKQNKKIEKK